MGHFGRSGPTPAIRDSFSLLVLNVSYRTTADDLFPLFDRCGDVVDIYIPRDRRTGDSRGFAFVRYKYEDEAQKAVDKLDGKRVDGRDLMVQFAKYGPNAERIQKGRIVEEIPKPRGYSRSRSPTLRYRDDYRDRDNRRRSRSKSTERYERDRARDDHRRRSMARGISPDHDRRHIRRSRSPAPRRPSHSRSHSPRKMPPSREGTPSEARHHCSPRSLSPSA